jgi:hypothetical protein
MWVGRSLNLNSMGLGSQQSSPATVEQDRSVKTDPKVYALVGIVLGPISHLCTWCRIWESNVTIVMWVGKPHDRTIPTLRTVEDAVVWIFFFGV